MQHFRVIFLDTLCFFSKPHFKENYILTKKSAVATPLYLLKVNLIVDDRQHNTNRLLEKYTSRKVIILFLKSFSVSGLKMHNHQKYQLDFENFSLNSIYDDRFKFPWRRTITDSLCNTILPGLELSRSFLLSTYRHR